MFHFSPFKSAQFPLLALLWMALLSLPATVSAGAANEAGEYYHPQVQQVLEASQPPEGLVFDIETLDPQALQELTPFIVRQIKAIKAQFPDVDIAVVSHGVEEVALTKTAQTQFSGLHTMFDQLVQQQDVSLHVCGAVAGLTQLTQEDFSDFVSYSDSGMAQINDYKALGYQVIAIKQLNKQQRDELFKTPEKYFKAR